MTAAYWVMGAVAGGVYSAGLFLQVVALNDIPASRSGFLTSLAVVFTPLLMIAVDRRTAVDPRVSLGSLCGDRRRHSDQ